MGLKLGTEAHKAFSNMSSNELRYDPKDVPNNGLLLNEIYLPDEIIVHILSFMDVKDLVKNCSLVCQKWYMLIKQEVWKAKAEREFINRLANIRPYRRLPDLVYQGICCKVGYNCNLLRNNTGKEHLKYWHIVDNEGDGWIVEKPPVGVTIPAKIDYEEPTHCFATSYSMCRKAQTIDLINKGIHPMILDQYQPNILVSEWISARWDCNSYYAIQVILLDKNKKELQRFEKEASMMDWLSGWNVISHTFENYGPGVRYIKFVHSGHDVQFWKGHYGSKMANASVIVDASTMKIIP